MSFTEDKKILVLLNIWIVDGMMMMDDEEMCYLHFKPMTPQGCVLKIKHSTNHKMVSSNAFCQVSKN